MTKEFVKQKVTRFERINAILDKMSIPEQLDLWKDIGDAIHQRIDDKKKEKQSEIENLEDYQNQLPKK